MISKLFKAAGVLAMALTFYACQDSEPVVAVDSQVDIVFGGKIDLDNLADYEGQTKPAYILQDNTNTNPITNEGATLGRVLFYDVNLSVDNNISCGHCHKQAFAFGDTALASSGVNGVTGRHSMRLVNSRFSLEQRFFLGRTCHQPGGTDHAAHSGSQRDGVQWHKWRPFAPGSHH